MHTLRTTVTAISTNAAGAHLNKTSSFLPVFWSTRKNTHPINIFNTEVLVRVEDNVLFLF